MKRLVALCALLAAPTWAAAWAAAQEDKVPDIADLKPVKVDANDAPLKKLLKERYNTAIDEVNVRLELARAGRDQATDVLLDPLKRLVGAGLELFDEPAQRLDLLKKHVAMTQMVEKIVKIRVEAGARLSPADLFAARYHRLDAEILLLREEEKAKSKK